VSNAGTLFTFLKGALGGGLVVAALGAGLYLKGTIDDAVSYTYREDDLSIRRGSCEILAVLAGYLVEGQSAEDIERLARDLDLYDFTKGDEAIVLKGPTDGQISLRLENGVVSGIDNEPTYPCGQPTASNVTEN
jgi:hypothetical protein